MPTDLNYSLSRCPAIIDELCNPSPSVLESKDEHTEDGGTSWNAQTSGTNNNVASVYFLNPSLGWAVANDDSAANLNSEILKTLNGGATWSTVYMETNLTLRSVEFINPDEGWVVGGVGGTAVILRTTDGGTSWDDQTFTFSSQNFFWDVSFADPLNGWTVGYNGAIFNTYDGGTNWRPVSRGTRGSLQGIHMVNENVGWVVGAEGPDGNSDNTGSLVSAEVPDGISHTTGWTKEGAISNGIILKTTNGGQEWITQLHGPSVFASVSFINATTGWVVGNHGTILNTTDGGGDWQPQTSGTSYVLQSVHFRNSSDGGAGWAVGQGGTILHTENGGADWDPQNSTVPWDLSSVYFLEDLHTGWVVGGGASLGGTILKTTNGGTNWDLQYAAPIPLESVYFANDMIGWAVGGTTHGWILNTTDGGQSWTPQLGVAFHVFRSVHFTDQYAGWAVADFGYIFETIDGGAHWTRQTTVFPGTYNATYFTSHHIGWVVGAHGAILHTGCPGCSTILPEDEAEDVWGPFLTGIWPAWPGE